MQVPVTLDSANRKKDRSVSMRFTTNLEISNADFAEMDKVMGTQGWLLFKENEFTEADIPKGDAPVDVGQKKPSTILRAVLYRIWEQKTDQSENFDYSYYPRIMGKIIERYKEELL